MAARLRPRHQEEIREKIKTSQLINFIETYALTGKDTGGQEVNPARLQAAKILLDKTLPSLQAMELSGEIATSYAARVPNTDKNAEQWQQQHSPVAPRPTMQ